MSGVNNCDSSVNSHPNLENLKPFKPGADKRRNLNGAPKKLPELEKLLSEVCGEDEDGNSEALTILRKVVKMAKAGNIRAQELIINRLFGLPTQKIINSGTMTFVWNEITNYDSEQEAEPGT